MQVPRRALASVDGCDKGPGICICTWVIRLLGSRGYALLPPEPVLRLGDSDTVHCRTVSLWGAERWVAPSLLPALEGISVAATVSVTQR